MTSIQAGIPLNSPYVKMLDAGKLKAFHISQAPEQQYHRYIKSQEKFLEMRHSQRPDTSQHLAYRDYAKVQVGGKTVAEIDNHGFVKTSNGLGAALSSELPGAVNGKSGPVLAQARAEIIAEALGGEVVKSSSALTQNQFDAIAQPGATIDYAAMRQDPAYEQLQKTKEARTLFLAQQIAQSTDQSADGLSKASPDTEDGIAAAKTVLDTSRGKAALDIDDYFSPKGHLGPIDLNKVPLLMPTAANIEALSQHVAPKFQQLLDTYGISEAPGKITYDSSGQITFPVNYPHADELKQALEDSPVLERELRAIAALASHYAGMQAAQQGGNKFFRIEIALAYSADGGMSVLANGKPLNEGGNYVNANNSDTGASEEEQDAARESSSSGSDAVKEFLDYMSKTPEERYYEAILKKKGLTKEQLEALPPDERAKIEAEILAEIKERMAAELGNSNGTAAVNPA